MSQAIEFADLVLLNGDLIRIECPEKYQDEFYESLEHAMKNEDWWSPNMWDGCKAVYRGRHLSRIAMNKVIGML